MLMRCMKNPLKKCSPTPGAKYVKVQGGVYVWLYIYLIACFLRRIKNLVKESRQFRSVRKHVPMLGQFQVAFGFDLICLVFKVQAMLGMVDTVALFVQFTAVVQ